MVDPRLSEFRPGYAVALLDNGASWTMNATRGSLRMPTQLINFQRQFQVWLYTVSLRQLLLRSNRSETHATRIDIHFMDVEAIQLPTIFDGLVLAEASQDEVLELKVPFDPVRVRRRKVFTIQSPHFIG